MAETAQRPECAREFKHLNEWKREVDSRLKVGDERMGDHDVAIATLSTDMLHLTRSMSALTKAIWGAVITIAGTGITFIIWYLQSLPRQ